MTLTASKSLPGVNRAGQLSVCCVCYPTLRIFFATFPHLRGVEVTSTYCPACFKTEIVARFATPANLQLN